MPSDLNRPDLYLALGGTLTKIASAPTDAALWSLVKAFIGRLGFSYVTAVDAPKMAGGMSDAVLYTDLPSNTLAAIDRESLARAHPIIQRCLASPEPFKLSELRKHPSHIGKRWTELLGDVVVRGDAVIVPVFDGDDLRAAFAFGGENPTFSPKTKLLLQVVAYAAFARAVGGHTGDVRASTLTVRETQCLRWSALGRGDADIGQTLGITTRTVRFHLDNAKQKLGVTTRAQAIAKGVNERLIVI